MPSMFESLSRTAGFAKQPRLWVPLAVVNGLVSAGMLLIFFGSGLFSGTGLASPGAAAFDGLFGFLAAFALLIVAGSMISLLIYAAVIRQATSRDGWAGGLRFACRHFFRMIGLFLLEGAIIFGLFAGLVVAPLLGGFALAGAAPAAGIAMLALFAVLLLAAVAAIAVVALGFFLAPGALLIDRAGVVASVKQSWARFRRHPGSILAAVLVLLLVSLVVVFVASIPQWIVQFLVLPSALQPAAGPAGMAQAMQDAFPFLFLASIPNLVGTAFLTVWTTAAFADFYKRVKKGR